MKDEILEKNLSEILGEELEVPIYIISLTHQPRQNQRFQAYVKILFVISCVLVLIEEIILYQLYFINSGWFLLAAAFLTTTLIGIPIIIYLFKSEIVNYLLSWRR